MIRVLAILLLLASPGFAVEPDEILSDPVLEERAREISANVRCVVCQNEPIDSSNAGIARDLRILIRERLVAGDSDEQVYQFLVDRYGSYVLFNPPVSSATLVLWAGPFVILVVAALGSVLALRQRPKTIEALSEEEEAALAKLREASK
ncbi:MAG: cytochrome c-type biogenesis protein [Pseudomonadota bacterium]